MNCAYCTLEAIASGASYRPYRGRSSKPRSVTSSTSIFQQALLLCQRPPPRKNMATICLNKNGLPAMNPHQVALGAGERHSQHSRAVLVQLRDKLHRRPGNAGNQSAKVCVCPAYHWSIENPKNFVTFKFRHAIFLEMMLLVLHCHAILELPKENWSPRHIIHCDQNITLSNLRGRATQPQVKDILHS